MPMKLRQKLSSFVATGLVLSAFVAAAVSSPSYAIDVFGSCGGDGSGTAVCNASGSDSFPKFMGNIVSVLLYALGAVAVIMIVVGGFKYVTSNGDSNNIQSAKNTILYSVVGLVVAIAAQMIVTFVVSKF